jgi:DNA mismatch endonuclease (patch repair protein)
MQSQARRDTGVERLLRSALHRRGLRFRVHGRPLRTSRREVDIVFVRARVAVFVDGCFWHGCPLHATWPKRNADWWRRKIEGNIARDANTDDRLAREGWLVLRVWEHEDPDVAADEIERAVRARLAGLDALP